MKKLILLIILSSTIQLAESQITLEGSFPGYTINSSFFTIVKFGLAGEKYVFWKESPKLIEVYNLNNVLENTITIPNFISDPNYPITYISDNLFDADSGIEYIATNPLGNPSSNLYILNEDGSILFERDTVSGYYSDDGFSISEFARVVPSSIGTKLILNRQATGWEVYSLPGNLPCNECSDGVFTGLGGGYSPERTSLSFPFPNPANSTTKIEYELPKGIHYGELVFYNTIGVEMKRFKITDQFGFIYISVQDLPSGTYYYNIVTASGYSSGQKITVIK